MTGPRHSTAAFRRPAAGRSANLKMNQHDPLKGAWR
jgi:hypothetical protein